MRNVFIIGLLTVVVVMGGCPNTPVQPPPPPPPPPVQHLVGMHWDDVGAPGYTVYRGSSADALAPIDSTTTPQYTDKSVAAGVTYFYAVTGKDGADNESTPSNVINATIPQN